jgi:hypothetical protein
VPSTLKLKVGEMPPLVGIAENVTAVPGQTLIPGLAESAIEGVIELKTFITTAFELAEGLPQVLPDTVILTLKLLPLAMLLVV